MSPIPKAKLRLSRLLGLGALVLMFALFACGRTALLSTLSEGQPNEPPPINDSCGDGACSAPESCASCPADCGRCETPSCGDGNCSDVETCTSCAEDCGACPESCGDGRCGPGENCRNCPSECGDCPASCGDNVCNEGEGCENCPSDCGECPMMRCGDGQCSDRESCESCPRDCGQCPDSCGDGVCGPDEGCFNCRDDCPCGEQTCREVLGCFAMCNSDACIQECTDQGCPQAQELARNLLECLEVECAEQCQTISSNRCNRCAVRNCGPQAGACFNSGCGMMDSCGNNACDPNESCMSCPSDCGPCPGGCGDGMCDQNEDCMSCPDDCGSCPPLCGDGICEAAIGENCSNCPQECACGGDNCGEVLQCVFSCSDLQCPSTCIENGCAEAQEQAQALLGCIFTNCVMSCIDPTSSDCQSCVIGQCQNESLSCITSFCN